MSAISQLRLRSLYNNFDDLTDPYSQQQQGYEEEEGIDPYQIRAAQSQPSDDDPTNRGGYQNYAPTNEESPVNRPDPYTLPTPQYGLPRQGTSETAEERTRRMLETIGKVYTPETRAGNRFNILLDEAPNASDYEPSTARRIVAGLQGWKGGPEAVERTLNAPLAKAVGLWKEKTGPMGNAAQYENAANVNERNLAGNVVSSMTAAERADRQAETAANKQDEITRHNTETEKISRERNAIAQAAQNGATFETKGEYIIATYKNGTVLNTGVKTTNFSPTELENLRQTGRMAVTGANNTAAMERTNANNAQKSIDDASKTSGGLKFPTPGNVKIDQANRAREILARDPEMKNYIKFTGTNEFTINRPKAGMFSSVSAETQKKVDQAVEHIYGPYQSGPSGGNQQAGSLQQRASDWLKQNNLPVTDANINHAIKTGRVK